MQCTSVVRKQNFVYLHILCLKTDTIVQQKLDNQFTGHLYTTKHLEHHDNEIV